MFDYLSRLMPWIRRQPKSLEICREYHVRRLAIVEDTHPDGSPRRIQLLADDDVIDLVGGEQFASLYLRTEKPSESAGGGHGGGTFGDDRDPAEAADSRAAQGRSGSTGRGG